MGLSIRGKGGKRSGDSKDNWIKGAVKHPGALHEALGVPMGKKIPAMKLEIHPGDSAKMVKMKTLAKTFRKVNK